jgi:hypothetical protein
MRRISQALAILRSISAHLRLVTSVLWYCHEPPMRKGMIIRTAVKLDVRMDSGGNENGRD